MSRIAILSGATGGLGQAFTARLMKEEIDEIWAVARNAEKLGALKTNYGEKIRPVRCDLSHANDLSALSRMIQDEKPDIRILINNAGTGSGAGAQGFRQRPRYVGVQPLCEIRAFDEQDPAAEDHHENLDERDQRLCIR